MNLPRGRIRMLGATLDPLTIPELNAAVAGAIESERRLVIGHMNLHGFSLRRREPAMIAFERVADLVFLDGMPLIWMARRLGYPVTRQHRVTYVDWIDPLLDLCARRGWRVFHLGGKDGVGERAGSILRARHPDLEIGTAPGYFDSESGEVNRRLIDRVRAWQPRVLLVGMGMPRQEAWVSANLEALPRAVILTSGACMDYVAGEIATPPRWSGRVGLEWLFRLVAEPGRLLRRYLWEPWPVMARFLREWARGSGRSD